MGETRIKPTHSELAARAMLLGDDWFYDWRDGTFNFNKRGTLIWDMYDPETMERISPEDASYRRVGRADGWKDSSEYDYFGPQWETPVARMDDD